MFKFTKQPWEIFPISIDFSQNMLTDETITSANSLVEVIDYKQENITSDIIVENSILTVDDTKLQAVVYGGTNGSKYKITFRAYISDTKMLEEDITMIVKD